jgi:alkylhydroperoxidase family enzyme
MCQDDMEPLRTAGLEDQGILQVCAIAVFFNYVNRMADALGVGREAEAK